MLNNKLISAVFVMVLSLILVSGAFNGVTQAQDLKIGLSVSTQNNPFFVTLKEGAQKKADEIGAELIVADAQNNASNQMSSVENLIVRQVDVLIINPVDSDAVVSAIKAANQANIPVITVDRGASGGEVVTHIASDNVIGGEMAGERIIELLDGSGKVVELQGIPGTSAARARGKGFHNIVDKKDSIEVVASQPAGFDRSEGMTVMENILQAHQDIDAVFAHNDSMALGAVKAIEAAGRLDEVEIVGFDAIDDALTAIKNGKMDSTIAQKPGLMGEMAVENAQKIAEGKELEDSIAVPLELITKKDVE